MSSRSHTHTSALAQTWISRDQPDLYNRTNDCVKHIIQVSSHSRANTLCPLWGQCKTIFKLCRGLSYVTWLLLIFILVGLVIGCIFMSISMHTTSDCVWPRLSLAHQWISDRLHEGLFSNRGEAQQEVECNLSWMAVTFDTQWIWVTEYMVWDFLRSELILTGVGRFRGYVWDSCAAEKWNSGVCCYGSIACMHPCFV